MVFCIIWCLPVDIKRYARENAMNKNNKSLKGFSQNLRKSMTKEEKRLWYDFLKNQPQTVHRQKVIGNYIVDFYCASAQLVIELDGAQHATDEGLEKDKERDLYLNSLGIRVVRIPNYDINKNFEAVCRGLHMHLNGTFED